MFFINCNVRDEQLVAGKSEDVGESNVAMKWGVFPPEGAGQAAKIT